MDRFTDLGDCIIHERFCDHIRICGDRENPFLKSEGHVEYLCGLMGAYCAGRQVKWLLGRYVHYDNDAAADKCADFEYFGRNRDEALKTAAECGLSEGCSQR